MLNCQNQDPDQGYAENGWMDGWTSIEINTETAAILVNFGVGDIYATGQSVGLVVNCSDICRTRDSLTSVPIT